MNDIVVVHRLVATSLSATWHLQIILCGHWLVRVDGVRLLSSIKTYRTMTNNDDVVVRRLVATLLSATRHLQPPPSCPFRCDMVLRDLAVVVVGVGEGCRWRPLVMVTMVVVVKRGWQ